MDVNSLKKEKNKSYIDQVFDLFIDNQINVEELKSLLSKENITLSNEFYELPKEKQKRYRQYKKYYIELDEKLRYDQEIIFNNQYYYELVAAAKRSQNSLLKLIKYVNELDDIAITILTMQNILLSRIPYFSNQLKGFIEKNQCVTLYDLYIKVAQNKNYKEEKKKFYAYFENEKDKRLNIDFNNVYVNFIFKIEAILNSLGFNSKELNTLKIKFLIYKKEYLKESMYKDISKTGIEMLKNKYDCIKINLINELKSYINLNKNKISKFPPNGYTAIYYSLLLVKEAI